MARRLRLPDQLRGQTLFVDPYLSRVPFRDLLLRRPTLPDPAALDRFVHAPGEVVGVLVGHTHFDHAVDAPAIARRFGCKAYGSDSLVTLMGLHGLAERAVEVEPYRTYELGPFEVSFTPSVHSKLLLGLAVPYDGDLTCEHLDALSPGAYRCGQVWGITIAVAGLRFYHQGSANLIDEAIRERGVDVFLAGVAGRSFTDDYWQRILPPPRPQGRRPHPLRQLLPPARPADWSSSPTSSSPSCRRRSARSAATSSSRPCRAPTCQGWTEPLSRSTWRRSARSCPWSAMSGPSALDRLQVELGLEHAAARQPVELAALDRQAVLVGGQRQHLLPSPPLGFFRSSKTWSLPFELSTARRRTAPGPRSPPPPRRCAGRPAPRSRAPRPGPASIRCRQLPPRRLHPRREDHVAAGAEAWRPRQAQRLELRAAARRS